MSAFVQFSKIDLSFGERHILANVSLNLHEGSKAALSGDNGSGKTTLLRVLAGNIDADSGDRALQKGARLSYLPQSLDIGGEESLRAYVDHAFEWGYALLAEQTSIADLLAADPAVEAHNYAPLRRYQEISDALEGAEWMRREERVDTVLLGLGFKRSDFQRLIGEFSPGWQMRAALAKVLLENPDILLLDEPTNYLDLEARNWLESFLRDFRGGFLLVSHDRYFLDATVEEVYELFGGVLHRYKGNYTAYEKVRTQELETLMAAYKAQQEEIQKLEDFIRRFGYKATKAAAAQERQKMLDKMVRIEIPETMKRIHFRFLAPPHSGRLVLTLRNIGKTYNGTGSADKTVLRGLDLVVESGEHLVVAGPNGAGKSTLLRVIAGVDPDHEGAVTYGAGVTAAYYSQDNPEVLDGARTLMELIENEAPLELVPKARDLLGAFLFRGDDVFKRISVLSGGERSRAALLLMLLRPANLLILDEPTNHLDLHSKDVLLDALSTYTGTILFVSHDRAFIEGLATRVLELTPPPEGSKDPSQVRNFPGKYQYYLEQREKVITGGESLPPGRSRASPVYSTPPSSPISTNPKPVLLVKNEKRRREREEHRLLAAITEAEKRKTALEAALSLPENYTDGDKCRAIQADLAAAAAAVTRLTAEWEGVADEG